MAYAVPMATPASRGCPERRKHLPRAVTFLLVFTIVPLLAIFSITELVLAVQGANATTQGGYGIEFGLTPDGQIAKPIPDLLGIYLAPGIAFASQDTAKIASSAIALAFACVYGAISVYAYLMGPIKASHASYLNMVICGLTRHRPYTSDGCSCWCSLA